ncbi:helix-turn-helix domain-containing protein [Dickeya parazeae]|uniref:helix-turn-helix domain-containing protein n=1 Tax=Dickeya parazeae TaxID=2893572 RepID=UPI001F3B2B1C
MKRKELVEICHDCKSPAFEAIHSAASGLFSVDAIPQETMRNFDKACLNSVESLQPLEIKALREKLNVSQPVFASYLNTSVSTVQKWESGAKRPSGLSLKLLTVVQKHGLKVLS